MELELPSANATAVLLVLVGCDLFTTTEEALASPPLLNFHFLLPLTSSPEQNTH